MEIKDEIGVVDISVLTVLGLHRGTERWVAGKPDLIPKAENGIEPRSRSRGRERTTTTRL
jgi:hypothetical protein